MSSAHERAAAAGRHGQPPSVDEGDPPGPLTLLRTELRPTPGRLGDTLRITVLSLIAISISEVFRTPMTVVTGAIVFFVSSRDAGSSITTAVVFGISVLMGTALALLSFMVSLSDPALRVPLLVVVTFIGMFLSRAASLGPVFFISGFIAAFTLTLGDEVLRNSLQSDTVSDTAEYGLPDLAFMPPEEALVHTGLWLALAVSIPVLLVIVGNGLTGRNPLLMLRMALADRLEAAADFCEGGERSGSRLLQLAKEGYDGLLKLEDMAAKLHGPSFRQGVGKSLIFDVGRLCSILLAWDQVRAGGSLPGRLPAAGRSCRDAAAALRRGGRLDGERPRTIAGRRPAGLDDVLLPLEEELDKALQAVADDLTADPRQRDAAKPIRSPRQLLVPDAFTNPDHVRFALKVTLAMMVCYAIKNLTNWPQIQTCIITCFLVALGSVGQTTHKATLRFTGALLGGALGIGAILVLMPHLDGLVDLLCVLTPVVILAAWIGSGSERVAYGGQQIALAFFVAVLQGYGPTLDMQTARDRVIGILLGDAAVLLVFTTIWPVDVAKLARASLGQALERLADLLKLPSDDRNAAENDLRRRFGQAIAQARSVLANDPYEPEEVRRGAGRSIDGNVLTRVQELIVPISVIVGHRVDPVVRDGLPQTSRDAIAGHHHAMSSWLRRCARWVSTGEGAEELLGSLPDPPRLDDQSDLDERVRSHLAARAAWYGILDRAIRSILRDMGPRHADATGSQARGLVLADG